MLGLSISEILFLAVLALIVIGPKQLPEVARTIGRFLNEFRRTTNIMAEEWKSQARIDLEQKPVIKKGTGPLKPQTAATAVVNEPVQQELKPIETENNPEKSHES